MNLTAIIIGALVAITVIVDIVLIAVYGKTQSISAWVIYHAGEHPMIPFCTGFVMGHLFWRLKDKDMIKKESK